MRYLGIDPGRNGSAVIVSMASKPTIDFWCYWTPGKHGFKLHTTGEEKELADLSDLAELFGSVSGAAVEALFVGPARQTIIGTAETAGALIAAATKAIGTNSEKILQRPPASRWRSDLLRLPGGTTASVADKYAKKVMISIFGENAAWKSGHAVDAACIALWCAGMRGKPRQ